MILLNDFFTIDKQDDTGDTIRATLSLNPEHVVYQGHFPGSPVMPGVLMVQTIIELMQVSLQKPLTLANADNIKFLSVVNPNETRNLEVEIKYSVTESVYNVNAQLFAGAVIFFKLKATLKSA